jgi:hypothetical protein
MVEKGDAVIARRSDFLKRLLHTLSITLLRRPFTPASRSVQKFKLLILKNI